MKIAIPYGPHRTVQIDIPDKHEPTLVRPRETPAVDGAAALRRALNDPVAMPKFIDFIGKKGPVLVLVNDASRPTPTPSVLDLLAGQAGGLSRFSFLVATGVHRPPSRSELACIFGAQLSASRGRIFIHDADRKGGNAMVGVTRLGTEVWFNRLALAAEKIVCVSSVEPHYFAGFTGGRKSFLPGISARRTIEQNHRFALDPGARLLRLRGNPVHEDMTDGLGFLAGKGIFSIQTVLDRERRIFACSAGHVLKSFTRAACHARKIYCRPMKDRADIVVCVCRYPMDLDLYQSQKAVENGKLCLKKGGIMILVSQCRGGIGDRAFYDRLKRFKDPASLLEDCRKHYELGFHKSVKFAELMTRAEIWAVTDLPRSELEAISIRPFPSAQEAVDAALRKKGPGSRVAVLMDASVTVPMVRT